MVRVALVTGGTRGIGAAISKALKAAGYNVAANYGSSDEAAAKFKAETGINVYKWDVSSFEACAAGVKKVEAELGPIDVLVNNAGITRDTQLHRMKPEQWTEVINTNLGSLFNMCRNVIEGMRERKFGRIINISSINGQKENSARPTIRLPRRVKSASPKPWCKRGHASASPSTQSVRAALRPIWSKPCRRKCCRKVSCRRSRSDGWASRKKSRAA